jgi:hypothetical protein
VIAGSGVLKTVFLVSIVVLVASPAHAGGNVRLSWDSCTGPLTKAVTAGSRVSVWASVQGQTDAHLAYQVRIEIAPSSGTALPDAWRFDPAGCQGSNFLTIDHLPPGGTSGCPAFQGNAQSLQIKDYSIDPATGRAIVVCADAYPAGTAAPNPGTRYFLTRVVFDHTYSTAGATSPGNGCGGVEEAVCFLLRKAEWVGAADQLEYEWGLDQAFLAANDPNLATCSNGQIPFKASTWGSLKAQYRH